MTGSDPSRARRPGSLSALVTGLVRLASTRVELFRIEMAEQQERLVTHVVLAVGALILILAALVTVIVMVAVLTPPGVRGWALLGLLCGFLLAAYGLLRTLMHRMASAPPAFHLTLTEIRKDWQTLAHPHKDEA